MSAPGSCSPSDFAVTLAILRNDTAAATSVCTSYDVPLLTVTGAVLAYSLQKQQADAAEIAYGLNSALIILGAFGVFVMQIGFAMFVAGVIRARNLSSILLKSLIDTCVSCIGFYVLGYGFTLGAGDNPNGFIGTSAFALSSEGTVPYEGQYFMWNWVFCAASTTIMAGSVAERSTFVSYLLYAVFYSCWVYPVYAHWSWSPNGWLSADRSDAILGMGAVDFAGSGVVHTLGGFAGLMGSIVLGSRVGRWDVSSQHLYTKGQNPALYLLGTFLLWFGWFFFNSISLLSIASISAADTVARTAITTALAASAGGVSATLITYMRTKTWNMLQICNGILGGLVSITSGCSVVEPWAALIAGGIAPLFVIYGEVMLEHLQIDDPAGAFAVHGLSGVWGVLFVGLLAKEEYVMQVYGKPSGHGFMGIFYGGHGQILLCNFIAVVTNIAWVCFWMYLFFTLLNKLGLLRVGITEEALGLDAAHMGEMNEHSGILTETKVVGTPDNSLRPAAWKL